MNDRAAFPEGRIIIVLCDFLKTELVVVIRADPLGGVDGALFQRRIDITAGDLLRHDTKLFNHFAGKAGNAHLDAFEIVNRVDLLTEPASHLRSGIARNHAVEVMFGVEFIEQFVAVAFIEPRIGQASIQTKGYRRPDREGRILADIIIGAGMAHFHSA